MDRRSLLVSALGLASVPAIAHHGWSSFDQSRPLWLQGRAAKVQWRNPHAELDLELTAGLALPADLAGRAMPAQSAAVDAQALLRAARLPTRKDRVWRIELAPLTRLEAWKAQPIKDGDEMAVLGFTFAEEKGDAILRAEYLFHAGRVFGLRSSPT